MTETFVAFKNAGLFPRNEYGVKYFANITTWTGVYIKPFEAERSAASFSHGQPQIGGILNKPEKLVEKYEVLQRFVLFKMQTLYILYNIDPRISPSAVHSQFEQNHHTAKSSSTLREQIIKTSKMNHFTYVQHPVGYHIDTFGGGKPVLENKICLVDDSILDSTGRGGAGKSKFVWALLDWK